MDDFVGKLYAYLVSFTTDAANRIVRHSGEGNGLEAWRRLHSECDPTSSMRRVAILRQVQNPPLVIGKLASWWVSLGCGRPRLRVVGLDWASSAFDRNGIYLLNQKCFPRVLHA